MPRITKRAVTAAESGSRWGVRSERATAPLLVFLLFGLPLFFVLNERDLGNDEAIYAFAVDTMLQDGEWLTPKGIYAGHRPFFEKPPLMFWLTSLPIKLGALPHNEFGYRFWPALFASLSFLYVYAIGRRIGGTVCGVAAALFLFTRRDLLLDHGLGQYVMEAPTGPRLRCRRLPLSLVDGCDFAAIALSAHSRTRCGLLTRVHDEVRRGAIATPSCLESARYASPLGARGSSKISAAGFSFSR